MSDSEEHSEQAGSGAESDGELVMAASEDVATGSGMADVMAKVIELSAAST